MLTKRIARNRETGSSCTIATKMTDEERELLEAMAAQVGMSRYTMVREILRAAIERAVV